MSVIYLTPTNKHHFVDRINRLTAQSQRQWGSMTVEAMLGHLTRSIEMQLGEVKVEDKSNWFTRTIARRIIMADWMKAPKGKIKAPPIFFPDSVKSFDEERIKLLAAIERFVKAVASNPERMGLSPIMGPVPLKDWARMNGKHIDHHLQQFGV